MNKKNEVAKTDYDLVLKNPEGMKELVAENLGPDGGSAFDLERIKIPTSGGTTWTIPGLAGDKAEKELKGIIIQKSSVRAYWEGDYSGANPPECSSIDSVRGEGEPSGQCDECPFSQWGSDPKGGKGQACKAMVRLFILMPPEKNSSIMPVILTLAPTSIKPLRKYMMKLLGGQKSYWSVETSITLKQATNAAGITYSVCEFQATRFLSDNEVGMINGYIASMKDLMTQKAADFVEEIGEEAIEE